MQGEFGDEGHVAAVDEGVGDTRGRAPAADGDVLDGEGGQGRPADAQVDPYADLVAGLGGDDGGRVVAGRGRGGTETVKGTTARVRGGILTVVLAPKDSQDPAPVDRRSGRTARAPSAVL